MEKKNKHIAEERSKLAAQKQLQEQDNDDINEEEEEALSLSDLPLIRRQDDEEQENTGSPHKEALEHQHQDFDFCSMFKESEMCSADELFFKGQILPLRHSISSEQGFLLHHQQQHHEQKHTLSPCRSVSMDHNFYSRSLVSSSRSSSINSNSSSSSSNTTLPNKHYLKPKPPLLPRNNQFQYNQPSPSPRFSYSQGIANSYSSICNYENKSHSKKLSSSSWNVFKLGLVTVPPEILNARPCNNNMYNNFGSRNSASSNSSCNSSNKKKTKKKQSAGLFGGCSCSTSTSIDEVRDSRVVFKIKRSASENEVKALFNDREEREDGDENVEMVMMRTLKAKKKHYRLSHHRTFEWLKQLSMIEGGNDDLS